VARTIDLDQKSRPNCLGRVDLKPRLLHLGMCVHLVEPSSKQHWAMARDMGLHACEGAGSFPSRAYGRRARTCCPLLPTPLLIMWFSAPSTLAAIGLLPARPQGRRWRRRCRRRRWGGLRSWRRRCGRGLRSRRRRGRGAGSPRPLEIDARNECLRVTSTTTDIFPPPQNFRLREALGLPSYIVVVVA